MFFYGGLVVWEVKLLSTSLGRPYSLEFWLLVVMEISLSVYAQARLGFLYGYLLRFGQLCIWLGLETVLEIKGHEDSVDCLMCTCQNLSFLWQDEGTFLLWDSFVNLGSVAVKTVRAAVSNCMKTRVEISKFLRRQLVGKLQFFFFFLHLRNQDVQSPSDELLNSCIKQQLLKLVEHYAIDIGESCSLSIMPLTLEENG